MPSFHKQDDLAVPLDSDSGTGTLLLQLIARQLCLVESDTGNLRMSALKHLPCI